VTQFTAARIEGYSFIQFRRQVEDTGRRDESDEELARNILKGDIQDFAKIVERYERPIFNLMYRTCRSEQEAADLTQDVFLRVYDRLDCFNSNRRFFPWLYTVAVNKAQDWRRRNTLKLRKLSELHWELPVTDIGSQQETKLLNQEDVSSLYCALDTLPDDTREILLLRYQQELPITELAEVFKISESAAKMRIARAIEQLKSVLGGNRHEYETRYTVAP
jgi:RNA polymerase sigma-70 factor, ECF subfamily